MSKLLTAALAGTAAFSAMAEEKAEKMPETSTISGNRMFTMTRANPEFHQKFFKMMTEKHVRSLYRFYVEDSSLSKEEAEKLAKELEAAGASVALK